MTLTRSAGLLAFYGILAFLTVKGGGGVNVYGQQIFSQKF